MIEGSTLWLATGSIFVRAKNGQVRLFTKREELTASLEGTAIYRAPINTETLMKSFQGRHVLDVCGDTPSLEKISQDRSQTEVVVPVALTGPKSDSWIVKEKKGVKTLIRQHQLPRLAFFVPTRCLHALCPWTN